MAWLAGDVGGLGIVGTSNKNDVGNRVSRPADSRSKLVCETVERSHEYKIQGYSVAKGMGPGRYLTSDAFSAGGYRWAIYFYPDGKSPDDNSIYVSVFVTLVSAGSDVRALFELALIDQSGKAKHKVHSHFARMPETGPYTLKYRGSMWGFKRFYRRTFLEASDFLNGDALVIHCKVGVVRIRVETPMPLAIFVPPSNISHGFKQLFESTVGFDIIFEVGDQTFRAHKLVLAARSPVFNAQFFGPIGNPDIERVEIHDVEPLVFKAMLLFIYSDVLPDVHELTGSVSMCTQTNMVQHLLAASDQFGLERMRLLCEAKLCEQLSPHTVATTLALADQHHCVQLKSICMKFMAARENLGVVMQTEGFDYLKGSCPSVLCDLLETVAVVEDDLSTVCRKRCGRGKKGLNPMEGADTSQKRMRSRKWLGNLPGS